MRDGHVPKEVLKKTPNLDPETKEKIMSGLQRMIQQGKQEGIQLGEKIGIQLGKNQTVTELVKAGIITRAQAEKVLKSK